MAEKAPLCCCRCNGSGKCKNCVCVKAKRLCTNCLPARRGCCSNTKHSMSTSPALSAASDSPALRAASDSPASDSPVPPATYQPQQSPMRFSPQLRVPQATASVVAPAPVSPINANSLPSPVPMADPRFTWGEIDSATFIHSIDAAYAEVVHWRKNTSTVPYGNAGKSFVSELSRLFHAYADSSALESVAMQAITVMSILLLQKPFCKSKPKHHSSCLERRMNTWLSGDVNGLVCEGRSIQKRLPKFSPAKSNYSLARSFFNLMFQGKTKSALQLLSDKGKGGVLHIKDLVHSTNNANDHPQTVLGILKAKHPQAQPASPNALINSVDEPLLPHPVIYERIEASSIPSAALRTNGVAGPSGLDAHCWRRMCTSFKSASNDLCHSLALLAKRLCTTFVDPKGLSALLACRLIALDKCPGVRPIGVCETARRIIAKAILSITRDDLQDVTGSLQVCAGQIAGMEAAVHAMKAAFEDEDTEAVLLVDASNAFNSLNRQAALHNIQYLCPSLAPILINTYREATDLFVDGQVLVSDEGTTQGDPLAMPMYALATIPLITHLHDTDVKQVWYADDATAAGRLKSLRNWWDKLVTSGPAYGYFANAAKTWLITKESLISDAKDIFNNTEVNISSDGKPHLGSPLGSKDFTEEFVCDKVAQWNDELDLLVDMAKVHPHAAYAAFTQGFVHKLSYLCRTTPNKDHLLGPLEEEIHQHFIPALTGHAPPNDTTRRLLALPPRLGGLGIINPTQLSQIEHPASVAVAAPLRDLILEQSLEYTFGTLEAQMNAKTEVRRLRQEKLSSVAAQVRSDLPNSLQRSMDLAQEKGASSWLSALPREEFGFTLHKGAFRDALALRYGWLPSNTPTSCACGASFTVEHALSCPKGGFPIVRHNEVRDLTANLMSEVCHDVRIEPDLQPITGEAFSRTSTVVEDGARLDISASGFWGGRFERAFFDVRVFNPHAQSNRQHSLPAMYRKHESIKRRTYEERVREVEHGSFTPLVMSLTGGLGRAANVCFKRLASMLASKFDQPYSCTINWLRCRLCFSLLRASIQCIRGARSARGHASRVPAPPLELVVAEVNV